jgi:hypothetical protein
MRLKMLAAAALLSLSSTALAQTAVSGTATPMNLGTDPGLTITGAPGAFSTTLFLGAPQVVTNLFTLGTSESSIELDDAIFTHSVDVAFSFTNPFDATGSPLTGTTSGFYSLAGSCSLFGFTGGGNGGCGQVQWTGGPQLFSFGDGGTFSIALNDAIFATPGSASISGTFTLLTPSVPEPATWAMMLLGFGAVGFALRRQKAPLPQVA